MWNLVQQLGWLRKSKRAAKSANGDAKRRRSDLFPALQVRTLEERRVFHAGAVAAPVAGGLSSQPPPTPPPPPTTIVAFDSAHNLVIQDASGAGTNDQLKIRFDQATNRFEISNANGILQSEIEGTNGNGTSTLFIPVASLAGDKLIVQTGAGNDTLIVDMSAGLNGKKIEFDSGEGDDSVTLIGAPVTSANYDFVASGTTQVLIGSGATSNQLQLVGVESIIDQLGAASRQFSIGQGIASVTLTGESTIHANWQLAGSVGPSVEFATPTNGLTILAHSETQVGLTGTLNLKGATLSVHAGQIDVSGTITSHDTTIGLVAERSLTVAANGSIANARGQIVLDAGELGTLKMAGKLNVAGVNQGEAGGTVQLLGMQIELPGDASIDATGWSSGGTVTLGGSTSTTKNIYIGEQAAISANALGVGNGGTIIIFAKQQALIDGSGNLTARGGALGGDGGFIETSGLAYLQIKDAPNAGATAGKAGTWLLDPVDVRIVNSGSGTLTGGIFTSATGSTTIKPSTIETGLLTQNVVINTGAGTAGNGDIFVDDPINASTTTFSLTLNAHRDIIVSADITSTAGTLTLNMNASRDIVVGADISVTAGTLNLNLVAGRDIQVNDDITATLGVLNANLNATGNVDFNAGSVTARTATIIAGGDVLSGTDANDVTVSGTGSSISVSGASIGASGADFCINPGTVGTVSLTSAGGITVLFSGSFATSRLTLNDSGTNQEIILGLNSGSLTVDSTSNFAANTANDNFTINTPSGNVSFTGGTFTANKVTINASGTVTRSGSAANDIDTSANNGLITISADSGVGTNLNPLRVKGGTGQVSVTTTAAGGSIFLSSPDIRLGQIQTAATQQTVSVNSTDDIEIAASSTTGDDWKLVATDDITLIGATTVQAAVFSNIQAGGDLISGSATTDFKQTGTSGPLVINAGNVGSSGEPILVDLPAAGTLNLTSAGDLYLTLLQGDLTSTRLTGGTISATGTAATIFLTAANGSINLGATSFLGTGHADDTLRLEAHGAAGNINLGSSTSAFAQVTLLADGSVTQTGSGVTLDTSGSDGDIDIQSGTAIGAAGTPLVLDPGAGAVSLLATTVINVLFNGDVATSQLTLSNSGNGQEIGLGSKTGDFTIDDVSLFDANTANDNFTLNTPAGNMSFTGGTLTANKVTINAHGAVTRSGAATNDIDTSATSGTITLVADGGVGASGSALRVKAGSGLVAATTTTGSVYLSAGTIQLGSIQTGSGVQTVSVSAAGDIDVAASSTTDDDWKLSAGGDLTLVGAVTLEAGVFSDLHANGSIISGTNTIDFKQTGTNSQMVINAGAIGSTSNPIRVDLGTTGAMDLTATAGDLCLTLVQGDLTGARFVNNSLSAAATGATIQLIAADGSIDLGATSFLGTSHASENLRLEAHGAAGNINLGGSASAFAQVTLIADGSVTQTGSGTRIDTSAADGNITIQSGAAIGALGTPVVLDPGAAGKVNLTAATGINMLINGDYSTDLLTLNVSGNGQEIGIGSATGDFTVNDVSHFNGNTVNDNFTLNTPSGNIAFTGATLIAAKATINAQGTVTRSGAATNDVDTSAANGTITLAANGGVGSAGSPLRVKAGTGIIAATTTTGSVYLSATDIRLGQIQTGTGHQIVSVSTTSSLGVYASSTTDDDWRLSAGTDLSLVGNVTVEADKFSQIQAGGNLVSGSAATDFKQTQTNGIMTIVAAAIGSTSNPIRVDLGATGAMDLTATTGDLCVTLVQGDLTNARFAGNTLSAPATGATIQLIAANGSINLGAVSFLGTGHAGDNLRLEAHGAAGNINLGSSTNVFAQVTLIADGSVTQTGTGTTVDTSAANGDITIQSGTAIGTSGQAVRLAASATSKVNLTAATGINVAFVGNYSTGNLTLSNTGTGQEIILASATGTLTLNDVSHFNNNTRNDNFTLLAPAGDVAFTGATLIANKVTIDASGSVTRSGGATNDIDTFTANGAIDITANAGVGASGSALRVRAGTGLVSATTTTGSVYLSAADIRLGQIQTGLGQQIVSVTTSNDLNVAASSTTDDDWRLSAGRDLSLIGSLTVEAGVFSNLSAVRNIVSGTATTDFRQTGLLSQMVMNAGAIGSLADPVRVDLGVSGAMDLTSTTGDLCVALVNGDLNGTRFVNNTLHAPASGATIFLSALNGSIDLGLVSFLGSGNSGDRLRLEAHGPVGNINLGASTIQFAEVTLIADGSIISTNLGTAIDTSAANGNITLQSAGAIGVSALLPLTIEAGNGTVSAITTGPLGNIFLRSSSNLSLGNIDAQDPGSQIISIETTGGALQIAADWTTEDFLSLIANGNISFAAGATLSGATVSLKSTNGAILGSGSATPDVQATGLVPLVSLEAQSIGTSGTPLLIDPGTGGVAIKSAGNATVRIDSGDFAFNRFISLDLSGIGNTFDFGTKNGSLNVNAAFASLADENVKLSAEGTAKNISIAAGTQLTAQSINLTASGSILGGGNAADLNSVGPIIVSGNLGIGTSAASPLSLVITDPAGYVRAATTTGNIFLQSTDKIRLDTVTTGAGNQTVNLQAANGIDLLASSNFGDSWTLGSSAGNLAFASGTLITANSFSADFAGTIAQNGATTAVNTSAANGPITLTGGSIGSNTQHFVVQPGTGDLAIRARISDIWLDVAGGNLRGSDILNLQADATNAGVTLTVLNGALDLNDVSHFQVANDRLTLKTQGAGNHIDFSGSGGPLNGAQVALDAAGSILSSGTAAVDVSASQAGTALTLTAGVGIGSSTDPLNVTVLAGTVAATAGTGNIYVQSTEALTVSQASATAAGRHVSFTTLGTNKALQVLVPSLGLDGDQWHLAGSGDVTLRVADPAGISFNQIADLRSTGVGRNVTVDAAGGSLNLATIGAGIAVTDDFLTLRAGSGNIIAATSGLLQSAALALVAPNGQIGTNSNAIQFLTTQINSSSSGSQWLTTTGTTRVGFLQTTGPAANITASGGTYLLAPTAPGGVAVDMANGTLFVAPNTTLGGNGRVNGNLHLLPNTNLNMGFTANGTGRLTVSGNMTLDHDVEVTADVNPPFASPGQDYDQIVVMGNLTLDNSVLFLSGGGQLSTTLNDIVLVDVGGTRTGNFAPTAGSLFLDGAIQKVQLGTFRGNLVYSAGDGNDIGLSQLSFTPPTLRLSAPTPTPRIPILTRTEIPLPPPVVPTQVTTAVVAPAVEPDEAPVSSRHIEVRVVVPIDEAGNVREEFAMKLPAEWLADLPAILRRLPDDRYRLFLMLEGGNEERLIMDVLVRAGRPYEPMDGAEPVSEPVIPLVPPRPVLDPPAAVSPPPEHHGAWSSSIGMGMAAATLLATKKSAREWADDVDAVAASIGQRRSSIGWRLWRFVTRGASGPRTDVA